MIAKFDPAHPDHFIADFYDAGATQENLLNILNNLEDGASEIMCHPGHVDEAFAKESIYNFQRERELKIITDPVINEAIQKQGIKLISFAEL